LDESSYYYREENKNLALYGPLPDSLAGKDSAMLAVKAESSFAVSASAQIHTSNQILFLNERFILAMIFKK
jgi:hypothetical protein